MNWLSKLFSLLKGLFTRPGLQAFLAENAEVVTHIVKDLADVRSGEDFHEWKNEAWSRVRAQVGNVAGNWISIAIALAFEELKARK